MAQRLKVVVTDYIEDDLDWEAEQLSRAGIDFACYQLKDRPESEVIAKLQDADIIVVNMLTMPESVIARMPKCRLLIRHGSGYDNVDVAACTKHGIPFAYQPDYCVEDVAEHAITLLFACARKLPRSQINLEQASGSGQWDFSNLFPIYRMEGKTLGIIGVGRIGSRVAAKLKSFGLRIIGNDPYLDERRKSEIGIEFVDKETLYRSADLLSLHTPLTDDTRHMINAQTLRLMKPTAYLVNTSRGPVVDQDALAEALRDKVIAGAAVDVYDIEPPPTSYPLFDLENAILTPHIGWASEESGWAIRQRILADITAFVEGRSAHHVVNQEMLAKKA
ncbi:MAG: C-terminal binding protein [Phycisphaerales bacterium]|nr:C-terminal binding protein [Phycisphaerales bacterium]